MLKKIIVLIAVLSVVFSFTSFADDEFYVYGEDGIDYLCEALNMDAGDINYYVKENNVTYFAVNKDNTKQIKRIEYEDEFSKEIKDLNLVPDGAAFSLAPELSGHPDALPELLYKGDSKCSYKIFKTEHKTNDSGGEYVITQFVTVKNSKRIIFSFYTAANVDRDYIDAALEKLLTPPDTTNNYNAFLIAGVVVFGVIAILASVLIIKDFRKKD